MDVAQTWQVLVKKNTSQLSLFTNDNEAHAEAHEIQCWQHNKSSANYKQEQLRSLKLLNTFFFFCYPSNDL